MIDGSQEYGSRFSSYPGVQAVPRRWGFLGEVQPELPKIPTFLGLDTYSFDGNKTRDWVKAKSEGAISFAIFAANWGTFPGPAFRREWPRIKDAGLVRGAYLFLRFPNPKNDKIYGASPA